MTTMEAGIFISVLGARAADAREDRRHHERRGKQATGHDRAASRNANAREDRGAQSDWCRPASAPIARRGAPAAARALRAPRGGARRRSAAGRRGAARRRRVAPGRKTLVRLSGAPLAVPSVRSSHWRENLDPASSHFRCRLSGMTRRSPAAQPASVRDAVSAVRPAVGSRVRRSKVGDVTAPSILTSPNAMNSVPYCSGSVLVFKGSAMTISSVTPAATGDARVPISINPLGETSSVPTVNRVLISVRNREAPWTSTRASAALLTTS